MSPYPLKILLWLPSAPHMKPIPQPALCWTFKRWEDIQLYLQPSTLPKAPRLS